MLTMNPDDIDALCKLFEFDMRSVNTVDDFNRQANLFADERAVERWYNSLFHPRRPR